VICLPRREVVGRERAKFETEAANDSYTRPRPGIHPGGLAYASSWGMSQRLQSAGHLEVQNSQVVVVLNS
jgi:hypothetical protein